MSAARNIHPSAEISDGALVGPGTRVWQHCIILGGAVIGANCKLGHNVFVEGGVEIGDGVTIKDNVAIYDGVKLEDEVFIGPNVVFTNVRRPRAFRSGKEAFLPTKLGHGATIGANATIVCGVAVGRYAMVGAGAVVTRDVVDHALMTGNPARRSGWVSVSGCTLDDEFRCPETGARYHEMESGLAPLDSAGQATP